MLYMKKTTRVYKINTTVVLMFSATFFIVSILVVGYYRMKKIRQKNKEKMKIEDILPKKEEPGISPENKDPWV